MGERPQQTLLLAVAVAAFAGGTVAATAPAHAQQRRLSVVGRASADPPVSPLTAEIAVREAAVTADRVAVASPRTLANRRLDRGAVDTRRLDDFARARELLAAGWDAYLRVQIEFAETRLVEARRVAIGVLDLEGGPALVADASLRLGAARLQQGRADEAARDFRLARALDPAREVGVSEFAPAIVAAFDKAVASQPPSAPLSIDTSAIATRVRVNGRVIGGAAVVEVPAGLVAVTARAPGRRPINQLLLMSAAGATVELRFERDSLASVLDGGTGLAVGAAELTAGFEAAALIAYAELDELVLVAPVWSRGGPALLGQRCEGLPVRCTAIAEQGFADPAGLSAAAAALWRELAERSPMGDGDGSQGPTLLSDRRLRRGEGRPAGPRQSGEPGWYRNPWLWAGAGAVAVALGVSLGLAFDGDDRIDSSVVVPPCEFAACD